MQITTGTGFPPEGLYYAKSWAEGCFLQRYRNPGSITLPSLEN